MKTLEARAKFSSASCLTPQDLRSAYFPGGSGAGAYFQPQTIALVYAYNDPKAEADLNVYSNAFGLPAIHKCSGSESDCFEQGQPGHRTRRAAVPQDRNGKRETKETLCLTDKEKETEPEFEAKRAACDELIEAKGWAVEMSTDMQMAHAVCQNCRIVLVEASLPNTPDLEGAEDKAVELGATEISNSWGGPQNPNQGEPPSTTLVWPSPPPPATRATSTGRSKQRKGQAGRRGNATPPAPTTPLLPPRGRRRHEAHSSKRSAKAKAFGTRTQPAKDNHGAGGGGRGVVHRPTGKRKSPTGTRVGCGAIRAVADVGGERRPLHWGGGLRLGAHHQRRRANLSNATRRWPIGGTSVASPIVASMFALAGGSHKLNIQRKRSIRS